MRMANTTSNQTFPAYMFNYFNNSDVVNKDYLSDKAWFDRHAYIIDRYVTNCICAIGITGNLINLAVLTRKSVFCHMAQLERSAHLGLVALAISDLLYCLCSFPQAWREGTSFGSPYLDFWVVYDTYGAACINLFLLCSSWLTVAMAVCRYLAICHPLKARQYLGIRTSRTIIVSVFVTSVLFNLPRFWMKKIAWIECDDGGRTYFSMPGYIDTQHKGYVSYRWLYFILGILVPLFLLCYCNIFLVRALKHSNQLRKNHTRTSASFSSSATSTSLSSSCSASHPPGNAHNSEATSVVTLTLCIIVILYIVLVGPAELVTFWRPFVHDHPLRYGLAVKLCNALQMLNFAVNVILYCIINVHFRKVIKDLVLCKHFKLPTRSRSNGKLPDDNFTVETSVML